MTDLFENMEMRALSWKEPYASLMLHYKIETRTWSTKYRGLVLICASKKPYTTNQVIGISGYPQVNRNFPFSILDYTPFSGVAIAVGELIDCRRMKLEDQDKCFVEWKPGLWCHLYKDVRPLAFCIPWKGYQGWKKLSKEVIDKLIV